MEGLFDYSLWGLFLASFLAATVVPFSSEALLSFLIINGTDPYAAVFAFLCCIPAVGDIFAVGLGILRTNILITAGAMLAGKFLRYVIWGWLTGLVF